MDKDMTLSQMMLTAIVLYFGISFIIAYLKGNARKPVQKTTTLRETPQNVYADPGQAYYRPSMFWIIVGKVVERGYLIPVRLVLTGSYLRMRQEHAEMTEELARSEGAYYLKDAQEWGRSHGDLQRRCEKAEAQVYGLQRRIEYLETIIDDYRQAMKTDEDAKRALIRNTQGKFVARPTEAQSEPEEDEDLYIDVSEIDVEEQAIEEELRAERQNSMHTVNRDDAKLKAKITTIREGKPESKQLRAYKMYERGAGTDAIAQALNISTSSVRTYVNAGRKEARRESIGLSADNGNNVSFVNGEEYERMRAM